MKKFFGEFKKFITRGNVVDMAVGVIVGSAFTAIVNGLSNNILKPLINYFLYIIMGKDSLSDIYTVLVPVMKADEDGKEILDLTQSIYIDWGAFINAVINFFLVAFVLFVIVKIINRIRERQGEIADMIDKIKLTKEDKKELKARGIKLYQHEAIAAYLDERREKQESEKRAKAEAEAEAARLEREANPTTEELLKKILAVLEKNQA